VLIKVAELLASNHEKVAEINEMLGLDTVKLACACEEQLDVSKNIINNLTLSAHVQRLFDKAKLKIYPNGAFY
jgi:hypothetical protein